jgi:hypothetical protein
LLAQIVIIGEVGVKREPTASLGMLFCVWLSRTSGCHLGIPLKSGIRPQTVSTGASIAALT